MMFDVWCSLNIIQREITHTKGENWNWH